MTLLGKALTVFIFVMSLAYLVIGAMVYATHENWHAKATQLENQLQDRTRENDDLKAERQRLIDSLAIEQVARRAALASLQAKLTQVAQQLQQRERQLTELEKSQSTATEAVATAQNLLTDLTGEVGQLRADVRKAQQEIDQKFGQWVTITDEVNQARRLQADLKQRQTQLLNHVAGYESILRKLGVRFEPRPDGTIVSDVNQLPPDVKGQVVAIGKSNLVEVSIGSDDGLRVGHFLDVYRNNAYLGRVVVRQTDYDRSVAEIIPDYRKGIIRKGDRVATKLN